MAAQRASNLALISMALCLLCGCQLFRHQATPSGKSPLTPLAPTVQQSEFEIFFVRLPAGDAKAAAAVWEDADEQALSVEIRRRLARNGFRAGVISARVPPQIAELLKQATGPMAKGQLASAESVDALGATQHQMYLRSGQRGELIASGVLPQFQVLEWKEGRPQGATFQDGQAQFSVYADPQGDGRVRVELLPEIHYGSFQQRYVSGDGMFRLDNSRKKKEFEDLQIVSLLSPGELLVVGPRGERPGSLGDRFFRDGDGAGQRPRLLLLRLNPSGHDPAFRAATIAATDSDRTVPSAAGSPSQGSPAGDSDTAAAAADH